MKKIIILLFMMICFIMIIPAQNQSINGNLHLTVTNGGTLRIGKTGDTGNINVPVGNITGQYNLDFSGYRDIFPDQIGARIAAIRYNNYQADKAYVQNTSLAFYTNASGINPGTTDLVERMRISPAGNVGIGTINPQTRLDVRGVISATEVKVQILTGADHVFTDAYDLKPLSEVESFIQANKHLPEVPSEKQMQTEGLNMNEFQIKLLQKIEELTLYVIQQEKRIQEQENSSSEQKEIIKKLQEELKKL